MKRKEEEELEEPWEKYERECPAHLRNMSVHDLASLMMNSVVENQMQPGFVDRPDELIEGTPEWDDYYDHMFVDPKLERVCIEAMHELMRRTKGKFSIIDEDGDEVLAVGPAR